MATSDEPEGTSPPAPEPAGSVPDHPPSPPDPPPDPAANGVVLTPPAGPATPQAEPAPVAPERKLDLRQAKLLTTPPAAPDAAAEEPGAEAVAPVAAAEEEPEAAPEPEAAAEPEGADREALRRTLEALLFAAEEPLTVRESARAAGSRSNVVRKLLGELRDAYDAERRPWELTEAGGRYRLLTRPEYFPAVQRLRSQRTQRKLTPAALETLALIAYSKEPIGRAEIEAVRGVDTGPVLRQLLERKLIRIAGRGPGLGQPLLYAVSPDFLQHFGLKSAQDLPQPGDFKGP